MTRHTEAVSQSSVVSLRQITAKTVRTITALAVSAEQQKYVASNAESIAEAYFEKGAWFRAVYADELPVGFVMLFDPTLPGASVEEIEETGSDAVVLWRFMIDQRYQRQGFGRRVLDEVVQYARSRPSIRRLVAGYVPGDHAPRDFYLNYGFHETGGEYADGQEVAISLEL